MPLFRLCNVLSIHPQIWGAYAHVVPGFADARRILAEPCAGSTVFFAGEATAYDSNPQTVHGAIDSGRRAALEVVNAFANHENH